MMIHEITEKVGKHKKRKRVGRGPGSGHGKTSGRGHKGAGSRSGFSGSIRAGREGGQMPWFKRFPKRGFSNAAFRTVYAVVNLNKLEKSFADGDEVNPQTLTEKGLIREAKTPVKLLGYGELTKKLTITGVTLSASAKEKIESAGGTTDTPGSSDSGSSDDAPASDDAPIDNG